MIESLKRTGACGFCCVGILAVSALAVATGSFTAGGSPQSAAFPAVALADDSPKHAHAPAVQSQVDAVVKSYLTVQKHLTQDKTEGIAAEFKTIREAAEKLVNAAEDEKLKVQAQTVAKHAEAKPKDLKAARAINESLSSAVIGLVQVVPPSNEVAPALYEATCPMAKANWLQTTKEITNPYMGQKMLNCGSIEQTIKAPAAEQKNDQAPAEQAAPAAPLTAGEVGSSCCGTAAAAPACH